MKYYIIIVTTITLSDDYNFFSRMKSQKPKKAPNQLQHLGKINCHCNSNVGAFTFMLQSVIRIMAFMLKVRKVPMMVLLMLNSMSNGSATSQLDLPE